MEDAMRQVLDSFVLLQRTTEKSVTWRLIEAKTNSPPFSVTAEADETDAALEQEQEFVSSLSELKRGAVPDSWADPESRDIVERLLARISSGATVEVLGVANQSLRLERADAEAGERAIIASRQVPERTKHQMGSVEGTLQSVESYYGKPAVRLMERKTRAEIACELSPDLAERFKNTQTFEDVWLHRRVAIYGLIYYNKRGRLLKVVATDAKLIDPRQVSLEEIQDSSFTGGLSPLEYLSKLRDGELD